MNKVLAILAAVMLLSACDEREATIDAKYLVMNDCVYSGESFMSEEQVWKGVGRSGHYELKTNRFYVYHCGELKTKLVTKTKLVLDKE